jgi:hypothetical protein
LRLRTPASLNLIVRRHIPMKLILSRTLWFALAAFLVDLILEAVTFEMPFSREWRVWGENFFRTLWQS